MIITNENNLPSIIEEWAKADNYERGDADFTTTELIKPERVLALERMHADQITRDVTDLVWRLSGQAKHIIFQKIAQKNPSRYIAEQRYEMAVAGVVISGQADLIDLEEKTLYDYKECKVWKQIFGDVSDWEQQANINAFLAFNIGNHIINKLVNIAIFKDWNIRESMRNREYPQSPIRSWELRLWDPQETLQFIQKRVSLHLSTDKRHLPLCSEKERWTKPHRWAVMKRGRKTAVKLFDTRGDADAWSQSATDAPQLYLEERKGEDTRCLFYCDVAAFCDHGQQVLREAQGL